MSRIGATTPAMMRRIIKSTEFVESQRDPNSANGEILEAGKLTFRNTSAFVIPPFGLMQLQANTNQAANQRIIEVKRPFVATGTSSVCLVNGPYEIPAAGENSFGSAQNGPTFLLKHDGGGYPAGTRLGWKVDSFLATLGCFFCVIGSDSLDTNLVRVMLDFSAITGTVSTAIPANETGFGVVDTLGPVISYPAKTQLASIAVGSTVLCVPRKGEWIAYKVC